MTTFKPVAPRRGRLVGNELGGDRQYRVVSAAVALFWWPSSGVAASDPRAGEHQLGLLVVGRAPAQAPGEARNPRLRGRDGWTTSTPKDA
jgi:hypothetical protein